MRSTINLPNALTLIRILLVPVLVAALLSALPAECVIHGATPGAVTGDIMLSLALWKAVSDRYEQLRSVWDSGRIGISEREPETVLGQA